MLPSHSAAREIRWQQISKKFMLKNSTNASTGSMNGYHLGKFNFISVRPDNFITRSGQSARIRPFYLH